MNIQNIMWSNIKVHKDGLEMAAFKKGSITFTHKGFDGRSKKSAGIFITEYDGFNASTGKSVVLGSAKVLELTPWHAEFSAKWLDKEDSTDVIVTADF